MPMSLISRLALLVIVVGLGAIVGHAGQPDCNTPSEKDVAEVIRGAFNETFVLARDQVRYGRDGPRVFSVGPPFIVLDVNGDGAPDLAAVGRYIRPKDWSPEAVSFNFGTPDYGQKVPDTRCVLLSGAVVGNKIAEFASTRQLFLLIILGGQTHCWQESSPTGRCALANVVPFANTLLSIYRGKVRPASAGDGKIMPPPRLSGDAVLLKSDSGRDQQIIYWTGKWFNWYPIRNQR